MLPLKAIEYLCYLSIFILLFKFSEAATIDLTEQSSQNEIPPSSDSKWPTNGGGKRETMKRALEECETGFSWLCLKLEFVKVMERLAEQEEFSLLPGVSVVKDTNTTDLKTTDMMKEVARTYQNDPSSRLNGYLITKLTNFLQTRYLRFKLIDSETVTEARAAVETGRRAKFGKKGGLEALLAAGLMMKGTLMAIGMGAIALMAGKALMTALMALTLSGVLGLKGLTSGGGKSTTYEIVAKPIYTSSHTHSVSHDDGHGGYGGGHSGGHGGSGYGGYARSIQLEEPKNAVVNEQFKLD